MMIYLNDGFEGGSTDFELEARRRSRSRSSPKRRGMVLLFHFTGCGTRGRRLRSGVKLVLHNGRGHVPPGRGVARSVSPSAAATAAAKASRVSGPRSTGWPPAGIDGVVRLDQDGGASPRGAATEDALPLRVPIDVDAARVLGSRRVHARVGAAAVGEEAGLGHAAGHGAGEGEEASGGERGLALVRSEEDGEPRCLEERPGSRARAWATSARGARARPSAG